MKVVLIEWEDACDLDTTPWTDIEDMVYTPLLVTQVGLVIYDGPEGIILTCASTGGQHGIRSQIPRGMIRRVHTLCGDHDD